MESAIAYLRVSTQRQQRSGLGIEAQRVTIARFAEAEGLTIAAEYVEAETGKGSDALDRRPQLAAALAAAKAAKCSVIVSKLDRLSRDVAFVSGSRSTANGQRHMWSVPAGRERAISKGFLIDHISKTNLPLARGASNLLTGASRLEEPHAQSHHHCLRDLCRRWRNPALGQVRPVVVSRRGHRNAVNPGPESQGRRREPAAIRGTAFATVQALRG